MYNEPSDHDNNLSLFDLKSKLKTSPKLLTRMLEKMRINCVSYTPIVDVKVCDLCDITVLTSRVVICVQISLK